MSIPLLGDISLQYTQHVEHWLDAGFASTPIASLAGDLQQRSSRRSHHIRITGLLFGDSAVDDLKKLQEAAQNAEEVNFAADIISALDLQKVVITQFRVVETAGNPNRFAYELELVESPPLPPPAQVEAFGGLGDFGVGDLGFDTDILGDLQDAAGDIAGAVDDALQAVDQLGALGDALGALGDLASMGDLNLGNFLEPLNQPVSQIGSLASDLSSGLNALNGILGS